MKNPKIMELGLNEPDPPEMICLPFFCYTIYARLMNWYSIQFWRRMPEDPDLVSVYVSPIDYQNFENPAYQRQFFEETLEEKRERQRTNRASFRPATESIRGDVEETRAYALLHLLDPI